MPIKKFLLGQAVQVVDDEGLDAPDDKRGKIGAIQRCYDDNTYDVLFEDRTLVNLTYYQIEEPAL